MIGIIVAMNKDRLIGQDGKLPWNYPGDMKRFKRITAGCTVVMGRLTWESIPERFRPLSGRDNIVLSSRRDERLTEEVATCASIAEALDLADLDRDLWFIGGARVYAEAMQHVDVIDVTHVPDIIPLPFERGIGMSWDKEMVFFPPIDEAVFMPGPIEQHPDEPELRIQRFERRYLNKDNAAAQAAGSMSRVPR